MAIDSTTSRRLRRRRLPLHAAALLQGVALWVPVERLFMTEIGFDAASIVIVANVALLLAVLIGGLSTSVTTYFVWACSSR
jgi:hypothetical protein